MGRARNRVEVTTKMPSVLDEAPWGVAGRASHTMQADTLNNTHCVIYGLIFTRTCKWYDNPKDTKQCNLYCIIQIKLVCQPFKSEEWPEVVICNRSKDTKVHEIRVSS